MLFIGLVEGPRHPAQTIATCLIIDSNFLRETSPSFQTACSRRLYRCSKGIRIRIVVAGLVTADPGHRTIVIQRPDQFGGKKLHVPFHYPRVSQGPGARLPFQVSSLTA